MEKRLEGRVAFVTGSGGLSSRAGVSGLPGWAGYAAAKGGAILFPQTLSMECGHHFDGRLSRLSRR